MFLGPDGRPGETAYCRFVPYKMHLKSAGKSLKFWCHRTDGAGRYYNDRRELTAAAMSADGFLVDAGGQLMRYADGQPQRAEVIKVKYTNGGNRGREVYTEVAAGRFFWALGFPADRMFPVRVWCDGCSEDPFKDIKREADNVRGAATSFFPHASIEAPVSGPQDRDRGRRGVGLGRHLCRERLERRATRRVRGLRPGGQHDPFSPRVIEAEHARL